VPEIDNDPRSNPAQGLKWGRHSIPIPRIRPEKGLARGAPEPSASVDKNPTRPTTKPDYGRGYGEPEYFNQPGIP